MKLNLLLDYMALYDNNDCRLSYHNLFDVFFGIASSCLNDVIKGLTKKYIPNTTPFKLPKKKKKRDCCCIERLILMIGNLKYIMCFEKKLNLAFTLYQISSSSVIPD